VCERAGWPCRTWREHGFLPTLAFSTELSRPRGKIQSNNPTFHVTSTLIPSKIFGGFYSWTWYPDNRGQKGKFPWRSKTKGGRSVRPFPFPEAGNGQALWTTLGAMGPPPPGGPLAKGPLQVSHFQPLATVQNGLSATPVAPTTCHSPTQGGRGCFRRGESRLATGYRLQSCGYRRTATQRRNCIGHPLDLTCQPRSDDLRRLCICY
jgi:hypothetical protein